MKESKDMKLWEEGHRLGCPCLRTDRLTNHNWIALNEDPCPTKKCKQRGCHNYGFTFHSWDRFIIVKAS